MKLANRFAYGYGYAGLWSPPVQGAAGMGMLGGESEEVARVEWHCLPGEGVGGFEGVARRLFLGKQRGTEGEEVDEGKDGFGEEGEEEGEGGRKPGVTILLSWKEPWLFLDQLRRWFQLLARALLPEEQVARMDDPIDVLKEAGLRLTVVVQHVEAQEGLERENYKEETFDYISQHLRTCILPLSAGLIYTASSNPPQQPGAPLNEVQRVVFTSLDLDLTALSPKSSGRPGSSAGGAVKKEDLAPKHNVVDRMAIVVPSGWDSAGKIRLLSETFSPEAVLEGWAADLNVPLFTKEAPAPAPEAAEAEASGKDESKEQGQAHGGAEVYESASPPPASPIAPSPPASPSKQPKSALAPYTQQITDPAAHKRPASPKIEVTTKPEQDFLAEMRTQLQKLEQQDAERQKKEPGLVSTTAGSLRNAGDGGKEGRERERERREGQSGALEELGDVAFNVGGVSYNAVSAEAAIERLKRPTGSSSPAPEVSTPRQGTPRPPKRGEQRDVSSSGGGGGGEGTPQTGSNGKGEMNIDQLEQYFASLMKRGGGGAGGGGSAQGTPSRGPSGA